MFETQVFLILAVFSLTWCCSQCMIVPSITRNGDDFVSLQEERDGEIDELHKKIAILEGALNTSRSQAEVALAQSRAQARVLLRKVKAAASTHAQVNTLIAYCVAPSFSIYSKDQSFYCVQSEISELSHECSNLAMKNTELTERLSELENVEAHLRQQLTRERYERKAAEDQVHVHESEKRSLAIICETAASEICTLRHEVGQVRNSIHDFDNADHVQVCMQCAYHQRMIPGNERNSVQDILAGASTKSSSQDRTAGRSGRFMPGTFARRSGQSAEYSRSRPHSPHGTCSNA